MDYREKIGAGKMGVELKIARKEILPAQRKVLEIGAFCLAP